MPKVIRPDQKQEYYNRRDAGFSMRQAAVAADFSLTTARTLEGKLRTNHDLIEGRGQIEVHVPEPRRFDQLCAEAKRAWEDFPYFQERYLGRIPVPWQSDAAEQIRKLIETEDEEYVVINAPPGSGKTLLFTHDIPLWLTVRNRAIRGQLGSVTGALAQRYTNALRRSLERTVPVRAPAKHLRAGTAVHAVATVAGDYGRFKPLGSDLWTKDQFIVAQADGTSISEKEATWSSYGFDQGFIGGRFDFIVWDDLVDPKKQRTIEAIENLQEQWDDQGETRLEPAGVLVLQGQRLAANDLYRYNIDKQVPDVLDEDTGEVLDSHPMYQHLMYKAHFPDLCSEGSHKRDAPAWGEGGCLLYPKRLPWTKIARLMANNRHFETVYQQEDVDPGDVLVPMEWIKGSRDFPGCLDKDRDRLELPKGPDGRCGLVGPLFSCISIDPSPTRYWGIEWWVYDKHSECRFLMDLEKKQYEVPDILDYNPATNSFHGLLEEWWQTSVAIGQRVTHIIFEANAAQRFFLQQKYVQDWARQRSVQLIPHTTHRNKSDPEFGVETIAPHYMFGRVRLPDKPRSQGAFKTMQLVNEVTKYGSQAGKTTDLTMAHWFFEFQLPRLFHGDSAPKTYKVPSWQKRSAIDPQMRPLNV